MAHPVRFLLLLALALIGCASAPRPVPFPDPRPERRIYLTGRPAWRTMDDVRRDLPAQLVRISDRTVDLRGCELNGSRIRHPKHPQDEDAIPVRISIPGFVLRNGQVRDIPGGLVVEAPDCRFEKLLFRKVGEDALSNIADAAPRLQVIRCRFENGSGDAFDKSLQANDGRGLVVRDCTFTGGITAIRIQESTARRQGGTATLTGNHFVGVRTACNVAGRTRVQVRNNTCTDVLKEWVLSGKLVVIEPL